MKLKLEHVARIDCAEIELNGVTVIAGYNGTGKSTISKSLYALTDTFHGLPEKVYGEKLRSVSRLLFNWTGESGCGHSASAEERQEAAREILRQKDLTANALQQIVQRRLGCTGSDIDPLYSFVRAVGARADGEYEKFIAERSFRSVFHEQISQLRGKEEAIFTLEDGSCHIRVKFHENRLSGMEYTPYRGQRAVYIGTLNVLDVIAQDPENFTYVDRLQSLLYQEKKEDELTFEEYQDSRVNLEAVQTILRRITGGKIIREGKRLRFMDDRSGQNIDFSNLASGMKTFVILQTLIENGALGRNGVLIIDEPEVNLHPEWQLKFADLLVLLHVKLGIRLLLNTHSPYFLRAVEIYLAEYEAAGDGKYYYTDDANGKFLCRDVTNETEVIYQALYNPLESL